MQLFLICSTLLLRPAVMSDHHRINIASSLDRLSGNSDSGSAKRIALAVFGIVFIGLLVMMSRSGNKPSYSARPDSEEIPLIRLVGLSISLLNIAGRTVMDISRSGKLNVGSKGRNDVGTQGLKLPSSNRS